MRHKMKIQGRTRTLPMVRNTVQCDEMGNSLCTLENQGPFYNEPSKLSPYQPFRPSVILLSLRLLQGHISVQASKEQQQTWRSQ